MDKLIKDQKELFNMAVNIKTIKDYISFLNRILKYQYNKHITTPYLFALSAVAAFRLPSYNFDKEFVYGDIEEGIKLFLDNVGYYHKGPKKVIEYFDMLHPDLKYRFTTISRDVHKELIDEAEKLSVSWTKSYNNGSAEWKKRIKKYIEYLNKVADGKVPFGYSVYKPPKEKIISKQELIRRVKNIQKKINNKKLKTKVR